MQPIVLILSSERDAHARVVQGQLEKMGVDSYLWNLSGLPMDSLTFRSDKTSANCTVSSPSGHSFDLYDCQAIWLRRPGAIRIPGFSEAWVTQVAEWETRRGIGSIFRSLPALWVNRPDKQEQVLYKPSQLQAARQAGLNTPDTLITNSPGAVRSFCDEHHGNVIYKVIDERSHFLLPAFELPRGITTQPFLTTDLAHLEQVRVCLHLFQQRIEKQYDLRITIIGKKLFAARIDSPPGEDRLDWRTAGSSAPLEVYDLPDHISDKLLHLMQLLDLTFGAVDMAVDRHGDFFFFEVNPAGQFLWIEQRLELPLSHELALLLAGR